jgi:hypothetical protein
MKAKKPVTVAAMHWPVFERREKLAGVGKRMG